MLQSAKGSGSPAVHDCCGFVNGLTLQVPGPPQSKDSLGATVLSMFPILGLCLQLHRLPSPGCWPMTGEWGAILHH